MYEVLRVLWKYYKPLLHSKSTNECFKDTENILSNETNTHISELNMLNTYITFSMNNITCVGSNPNVSCRQLPTLK